MAIFPKPIYRLNSIPIKFQLVFAETDTLIIKLIWKCKGPRMAKTILKRINKVGRFILADFKTYYKATVIKTVSYWYKNRHIDLWNGIESLEIKLFIYGQLIFNKGAKIIQWGKE